MQRISRSRRGRKDDPFRPLVTDAAWSAIDPYWRKASACVAKQNPATRSGRRVALEGHISRLPFIAPLTPSCGAIPWGCHVASCDGKKSQDRGAKSLHACEVAKELKREGWYAWDSNPDGIVSRIERVRAKSGP